MEERKKSRSISNREQIIQKAQAYSLFDDCFVNVTLSNEGACQYVLRTILEIPDLVVKEVRTQYTISKLASKSSRLDVLAQDSSGKLYNIEIQQADNIDHPHRVRYYTSLLDSEFLAKGSEYDLLPEVYVIYISKTDIWQRGKVSYSVVKTLDGIPYEDGQHIIYVNAGVQEDSALGSMMQYFRTADPNDMRHGELSEYVHYLKTDEGGHEIMCEITREYYEEGRAEGIDLMERAIRLVNSGIKTINELEANGIPADVAKRAIALAP